jgi:hypothetical protein
MLERYQRLLPHLNPSHLFWVDVRSYFLRLIVNSAFWDAGIFFKAVKEYLEERKITLERRA